MLDAFTGKITPIAEYTRKGQTVTVQDQARPRTRRRSSRSAPTPTASGSAARGPTSRAPRRTRLAIGNAIVIRDGQAGTYKTTLDNGKTVVPALGESPRAIDLTNAAWHLDAEDWQPVNAYGTLGAGAAR